MMNGFAFGNTHFKRWTEDALWQRKRHHSFGTIIQHVDNTVLSFQTLDKYIYIHGLKLQEYKRNVHIQYAFTVIVPALE